MALLWRQPFGLKKVSHIFVSPDTSGALF